MTARVFAIALFTLIGLVSMGGGYVCAAVHNIQGPTPVENIPAFFRGINDS